MRATEGGCRMDRCDHCIFWKMARPEEGWCLRRAPKPAGVAEGIAHWPTTHGAQGCGEFMAAGSAYELVACGDCRYWRRHAQGLQPVDRGDKPAGWWAQAGKCTRHAPAPQSEPGPRAFWRASHVSDCCAEGLALVKTARD
jgi:hypothetical protein